MKTWFPAAPLVHVAADLGTIMVVGEDRDDVVAEAATAGVVPTRLHAERSDDALSLKVGRLALLPRLVSVRVAVPLKCAVSVRLGSGRVCVMGVLGGADVSSAVGQIEVAAVGGELLMALGSGWLSATRLEADVVTARCASGAVDISTVTAPRHLEATVGVGAVSVTGPVPVDADVRVAWGWGRGTGRGDAAAR